jgi:hypothetical protein
MSKKKHSEWQKCGNFYEGVSCYPFAMHKNSLTKCIGEKCFYCNREAKNITIDEDNVLFYLCEKHMKLFSALHPKKKQQMQDDDF